ncbi:MAG TPA: IPT/TIG domain-containing protein [Bryobacteraceae bacterium]|nr:IPT/TIG domain-containing protein [Bryobacteraceae bacterium]
MRVVGRNGIIWAMIAGLSSPGYTVSDRQGNFYITDTGAGTIVMMNSSGVSSAVLTNLQSPYGLALDGNGNLYFTETSGPHVRRLGRDGSLTSLGEGIWRAPQGISLDSSGNLFVADSGLQQILEISSSGQIFAIAGTGTAGLSGDGGDALSAQLGYPSGVCTGPGGTLYIADSGNNRIRQLTPQTTSLSAPLALVSAVNAATLQPGPLAPGMLLDLLGTGLAASDAPNVQVMFDTIAAPVLTLDTSRLVVQVPPQVAGQQSANIQIVNQGKLLAQIPVGIAATAPGIFTTAAGQAAANNADGSVNSPTNPAPRGSVIALYGTGEGVSGLPAIVSIGGYAAEVLYQGEVAGYPGLLQINARVPAGYVPPGNLSVVVTIGQASSQTGVTVAVN